MKINFYEYFFFLHWKMLKPKGSIFIFLVLLKLSEENEMSEVLGSFSADHAALYTAYRNIIPNELSFVFQKGGLSIYFLTTKHGSVLLSRFAMPGLSEYVHGIV